MVNNVLKLTAAICIMATSAYSADFKSQTENACDLKLSEKMVGDAEVLQVVAFPDETRRNHYGDRPTNDIDTLVVMFASSIQGRGTIRTFSNGIGTARTSVHYLTTQTQNCETNMDGQFHIDGGKIIQIVPDDKKAWANASTNAKGISVMFDYYGQNNELQAEQIDAFKELYAGLNATYNFTNVVLNPKAIKVSASSIDALSEILGIK